MNDVVTVRIETKLLERIDKLSKEEELDRSMIIRKLIQKGYKELIKEKAAQEYIEEKITISEAAHKAGLTILDMQYFLIDKGFKSEYSIEDLQKELENLK